MFRSTIMQLRKEIWDCLIFKINGKLYHTIGNLILLPQELAQFLQVCLLGNTEGD